MTKVFYTPQISISSVLNFADCKPSVISTDNAIANAYLVEGYTVRSAWDVFNKGPTPPPFFFQTNIENNLATYSIYFNEFNATGCVNLSCNLQCLTQSVTITGSSGNSLTFNYCNDGSKPSYTFQVSFSSDSERESTPASFNFTFEDSLGNTNSISTQSISYIKPMKPNVGYVIDDNGKYIGYVGVNYNTVGNVDVSTGIASFVIQKSINTTKTNHEIIINENVNYDYHDGLFKDTKIKSGDIYNYRVKFRNNYKEESQWSDWSAVDTGYDTGVSSIEWSI